MQIAGVLLEEHDRIEKLLLLCSLIHEIIASSEDGVVLYAIAEVLDHRRLYLFILDEDGKANVVKLPSSVDVEVVTYLSPLC